MHPHKRQLALKAIGIAAAMALVFVVAGMAARPSVKGSTAAEKIESIRDLAARAPVGTRSALSSVATKDPEPTVRAEALNALARLGPGGARAVVEAASRDDDADVRIAAIGALAALADLSAVRRLGAIAGFDGSPHVRSAAMAALGRIPRPQAIEALVNLMHSGPDSPTKVAAAQALRRRCRISLPIPRPAAGAAWDAIIARIKADKRVRDAYQAMGKPLHYRQELLSVPPRLPEQDRARGARNPELQRRSP